MAIRKTDRKTQMMDAGTALFSAREGIGMAIGYVRRKMEEAGGEVANINEVSQDVIPTTTGDFDLFMDFSTPWRSRYISAKVEDAGEGGTDADGEPMRRYAAVFKEGNRTAPLRAACHILVIAGLILTPITVGILFPDLANFVLTVLCLVAAGYTAYRWIVPSKVSQKKVAAIQRALREGNGK